MFNDARSRKVIFLAHCLLNQNAVSSATAVYPGMMEDLPRILQKAGAGVVQMPCPELMGLGLARGNRDGRSYGILEDNTRIRQAMKQQPAVNRVIRLIDQVMFQIMEYRQEGFEILGIVGINRSPSCGVETTTKHQQEIKGKGLFIIGLEERLESKGIGDIKIIGIRPEERVASLAAIKSLIVG